MRPAALPRYSPNNEDRDMKQLNRFLIALMAALGFASAALAADAGTLKMRFTQSGNTSSSWPLYVAEQKKIFERNGLQVEVIIINGASAWVQ